VPPRRLEGEHGQGHVDRQHHEGDQEVDPQGHLGQPRRYVALLAPPHEGLDDLVEAEQEGQGGEEKVVTSLADVSHRVDADGGDHRPADQVGLG